MVVVQDTNHNLKSLRKAGKQKSKLSTRCLLFCYIVVVFVTYPAEWLGKVVNKFFIMKGESMSNKIAGFKLFGTSLKLDEKHQVNPKGCEIHTSGRLGHCHIDWKQLMKPESCPNCGAPLGIIMAEEGRVYRELVEVGKLLHIKHATFSVLERLTTCPFANVFEIFKKRAQEKGWEEIAERVQIAGFGSTSLNGSTRGFPVLVRTGNHSHFEIVPLNLNAPIPPAWMFLVQASKS